MRRGEDTIVRGALLALGVYQLGLGGLMALAPATFYALNHLLDVGEAEPPWVGVFVLAGLVALAAVLAWLIARAHRTTIERTPA